MPYCLNSVKLGDVDPFYYSAHKQNAFHISSFSFLFNPGEKYKDRNHISLSHVAQIFYLDNYSYLFSFRCLSTTFCVLISFQQTSERFSSITLLRCYIL